MAGSERDGTGNGLSGTAAENNEGGTTVESQPKRTRKYAKLVAAVVSLLLLGVMASGALAEDSGLFSPLAALTGSTTTTTTSTDTTAPTTTAAPATTAAATTTAPAPTTTAPATTTAATTSTSTSTSTTGSASAAAVSAQSITSDKEDYAPGSTVTLTG